MATDPTTVEDIMRSMKKMKNNKSSGLESIPIEFYKLLEGSLCDTPNGCWNKEVMPDESGIAELVTLYRKRDV